MLLLVLQEAISVAKMAGTVRTGEWSLLRGMDPPMAPQPGGCSKSLATDVAAVALGVCVGPAVVLERQQVGQEFGTQGAGVESSGMGLLVVQQATSMAVGAPTLGTAKGTLLVFSCCEVCSLSSISRLPILFWVSARFGWVLLSGPWTRGIHRCHPSLWLSGLLCLTWHLAIVNSMSLHVCGQLTVGRKHFAAVTTSKGLGGNVVVDLSGHRTQYLWGTEQTTVTDFLVNAGVQEAIRLIGLSTLAARGVAL